MSDLIQVPATVVGMSPKIDRSWKLVFETRELSGDEVKILADNLHGEGWLVYKPNEEVHLQDVPDQEAESGVKTPSQRLRAKIYILWKQRGGKGDFESFYRTMYQKFDELVASHLEKEG